jgi:hypothetical protein
MSFQEKSNALMLGLIVVIYGGYFAVVGNRLIDTPAEDIAYEGIMLATVLALVVLSIGGHLLIATTGSRDANRSDERDRLIDLQGEWVGGFALGTGAVIGIVLATSEVDNFWIANVLLAAMVLSEIITAVSKLVLYRWAV